jgi:hypothetical protein
MIFNFVHEGFEPPTNITGGGTTLYNMIQRGCDTVDGRNPAPVGNY